MMMHFLRWGVVVFLLALAMGAGGCGVFGDDGRMDAWKDVQKEKEKTKQELLKTKQEEFKAGKGQSDVKKRNPTLKVTTKDSADKDVVIEMDMAPSIAAATGHSPDGDDNIYGVDVKETPMPKGAVAEGLDAAGNAVTKVANAPAVVVGATGAVVAGALKETGGGGIKAGGNITMENSNNQVKTTQIQTGGGTQTGETQGTAKPTVVEPTVYDPSVAAIEAEKKE
jgi:hypothetical protein